MYLAKVIGSVVSTIKHDFYKGEKLLLVKRISPNKTELKGKVDITLDRNSAGVGDLVLVIDEGNSARQIFNADGAPLRSVAVGIIDSIDIEN